MADGHQSGRAVRSARPAGRVLLVVLALTAAAAGCGRATVAAPPAIPASASPTTTAAIVPAEPTRPAPPTTTTTQRRPRPAVTTVASQPPDTAARAATASPAARLQAVLDQWLAAQPGARSVAVAVAHIGDDRPSWTGEAHLGEPLLHAGDEYGILSITKTFTEALVLREVAAGRIDLDAPMPAIGDLTIDPASPPVTPRMLLQHTSGLVDYKKAVGYDPSQPITPRAIVSLALHSPRLAPPGREASYSNSNFHWLGLLLEQVTGRSYGDLVAGLAAELGLTHTRLDPAGRPGWIGYASGGVRSTVEDIARWGAALFTPGRLLSPEELTALTTVGAAGVSLGLWPLCPCTTGPDGAHRAGLRQTVAHGGFFLFPERDLVVVVHYEPSDTGVPEALANAVAEALGR